MKRLIVLMFVVLPVPLAAQTWQGTMETHDGMVYVSNPAEPFLPPESVTLVERWRIGGQSEQPEELFGLISDIAVAPDGTVYLVDSQLSVVRGFDGDGHYLRSFGREGEGPGEFRHAGSIVTLEDGSVVVAQTMPNRIVVFAPDNSSGTIALEDSTYRNFFRLGRLRYANERFIVQGVVSALGGAGIEKTFFLDVVTLEGMRVSRLYDVEQTISLAKSDVTDIMFNLLRGDHWVVNSAGTVAIADNTDYTVTVRNVASTETRVVTREYLQRKRTKEELKALWAYYEPGLRRLPKFISFSVAKYDRAIEQLFLREDGTMWVLTSRGLRDRPEGSMAVVDILDAEGRFRNQLTLYGEGDPEEDFFFLAKDTFFVVVGAQNVIATEMADRPA